MADMRPRIAVIGAGWAARIAHLPAYSREQRHARRDRRPQHRGRRRAGEAAQHPERLRDWREMLAKEKPGRRQRLRARTSTTASSCSAAWKPARTSCARSRSPRASPRRRRCSLPRTPPATSLMAAQNWRWNENSRAIRRIVDSRRAWARSTTARRRRCAAWASRRGASSTTSSTRTAARCSTSASTCSIWPCT